MREYVLAICAAALLCGLLLSLPQEGLMKELIKLLCASALTLCALSPLTRLQWSSSQLISGDWSRVGQDYAAQGEKEAQQALESIIRQQICSYIMDKATDLGLELEVEVELDGEHLPVAVTLRGAAPPYLRLCLEEALSQELGIAKEKLQWIG